jgi:hypothetical protein
LDAEIEIAADLEVRADEPVEFVPGPDIGRMLSGVDVVEGADDQGASFISREKADFRLSG